jgi:hypothetical protein
MESALGRIRSAASAMVAAAEAAIRAKAKIHSPSRLTEGLGEYFGEGFVNGVTDMKHAAWRAAQNLVSIPEISTPNLTGTFDGEMSADLDYYRNSEYIIEVPLSIDGKKVAQATASYTQDELNKRQTRDSRKRGKV